MSRRLTTEQFIEKAKAVHGDRYDYSQVEYVNDSTKVTIICPDHSPFLQIPRSHLNNRGCPDCGGTKPLSTAEFISRAKAVHGDRYDYSQVEYVNSSTKVMIICPDHRPFFQIPHSHLRNNGCPECGGVKKNTTETFIEKAKAVHGDRYDYSQVEYVNKRTPVTIQCSIHCSFSQIPNDHLSGKGCPECGGTKKLTTATFIKQAIAVHGDRYDYSQVEYVNNVTPVTIICPDHGRFDQVPNIHTSVRDKCGCPECGGTEKLTTEAFIERAIAVHGNRYDYSSVSYVNAQTKVTIICHEHDLFEQTPDSHLSQASGCPDCAETGFNPNERGILYYIAVNTDDGDTRYKIGITNTTVQERFRGPDLARIRIVKIWQYAIGREAAAREAEILRQYAGNRYNGPNILRKGNTELFTHDVLGLDD